MKTLLFMVFVCIPSLIFGQKASIVFEKTTHDFGVIAETGGNAEYNFVFKNTGSTPLIISNVRASCGCTTPTWTREPVAPNQTGSIKVSYNPVNRPGRFSKSITINSNAENTVSVLIIKGDVQKKPADPYANFKFNIGKLKAAVPSINIGDVYNDGSAEKTLEVANTGETPLTITLKPGSSAVSATATPATLNKGEKGVITVKYDGAKANEWDFVRDKINITTSEGLSEEIPVTAIIKENFAKQAVENYANSPVAVFTQKDADLGVLEKNSTTTHEFQIENTGKSNLIIRKVITSDNDIAATLAKTTIKPGKSMKVSVAFKTDDKPGKKIKIVTYTTNDPKNVHVSCRISGEVK